LHALKAKASRLKIAKNKIINILIKDFLISKTIFFFKKNIVIHIYDFFRDFLEICLIIP